jgi:hypothetical protein
MRCQTELKIPTKLVRLPGRNIWRLNTIKANDIASGSETADMLFKNGYRIYGWDVEWMRANGRPTQSAETVAGNIERLLSNGNTRVRNHLILLAHDDMYHTAYGAGELRKLVQLLKAKGKYRFDFLSNYPG